MSKKVVWVFYDHDEDGVSDERRKLLEMVEADYVYDHAGLLAAFDTQGRLFALDNDPDSRGPNRLLHVVEGGDYGYKSLYGGSRIHPYLAWNGELPGTLPYAAGVGEAPTGFFLANTAALPEE